MTFSEWDEEEPRGGDRLGCAQWKFGDFDYNINSWSSVECGNAGDIIVCQNHLKPKIAPLNLKLSYSHKPNFNYNNFTGLEIFLVFSSYKIRASTTLAIASGFLKQKIQEFTFEKNSDIVLLRPQSLVNDHLKIEGIVFKEDLVIPNGREENIVAELGRLFFQCDSDNSTHGVPWSQVCDGVKDCSSGDDESLCGEIGYPSCSNNQFSCVSKQCVPLEARCDLIDDCQDGSDEKDCELECPHRLCNTGRCLPRPWFNDGQVDCSDGSDESKEQGDPCIFICNRTQCVTREMLNDGVLDCKGPEGPLDETLGALESITCNRSNETPYRNNWAPKCVLFFDIFGEIIGCRNFMHLKDCENFRCPAGYAKCPESFCIPLAYVNDGKEDCDEGQDEGSQDLEKVDGIFKCHPLKSQYVPLESVCDGRKDCLQGEDELECDLTCFPGFICLAGAISASKFHKKQTPTDWSFVDPKTRYLDISGVHVPDFFKIYPKGHFNHLIVLNLSSCYIQNITRGGNCDNRQCLEDFKTVQKLDLSYNNLLQVKNFSILRIMRNLKELDLSHNDDLSEIASLAFVSLWNVRVINLSYTNIFKLSLHTFSSLKNLQTFLLQRTRLNALDFILPASLLYLNIEQTNINTVRKDVFTNMSVSAKEIYSPTYKLCCPQVLGSLIPKHACIFPKEQAVFSCEDLVKESPLRAILWLIGFFTLFGNIVTLLYRLTWGRQLLLKPHGMFVTNLGVSDTLMGFYLTIIAVADLVSQREYALHDHTWRNSWVCWFAGTMATLSSITSTLFITLITVDRFLAVRYPYGDIRFSSRTMSVAVAAAWFLGISLATLLLLPFAQHWTIYSHNGMCIGLPLTPERLPGWQYSVSLFVVLNFFLFLFIGVGQGAIYKNIKEKARRIRKSSKPQSQLYQNQRKQEIAIAKQLSLVVMSNFLCWCPIITLGLVSLSGVDTGEAAYRWSAIVILPINSALNPLLYTVPAIKEKVKEFRRTGRLTNDSVQKSITLNNAPGRTVGSSLIGKIQKLKLVKQALFGNDGLASVTTPVVELFQKTVTDLREVCKKYRKKVERTKRIKNRWGKS
ncbi:relaxin receptor-like protein [Elysia marginata]|uniref:Relaxin receptor-like protein n=1 Tax=Elysia marginata TaxID=1093978 RepID=A0AAV4GHB6_9GAST|nr:relaxin receptor-like protein [Elysia marginata]